MPPFSSFIFNSKEVECRRTGPASRYARSLLCILLWTTATLILLDAAIGFTFRTPADPLQAPSSLQAYFDYGRSIEGKLRREIGTRPENDAPILKAGWLAEECRISTETPPGKLGFDIYGMSFSNRIADEMERLDPGLAGQRFSGPAAPPNHSYACFVRRFEAGEERAPIQILGILASSIQRMETISGLTTSFESPQPYTYPRYSLSPDGRLVPFMPSITSQNDLRAALAAPAKWRVFLGELEKNDVFYVPQIFQADAFDHSVLARMIRRAWGQRALRNRTAALRAADGFAGAPSIRSVLPAMIIDFAQKAGAAGQRPIVILIEDHGYGTALSVLARPTLLANQIEFIATSTIASPDDTGNFVADGHFVPAVDRKIARAVLNLLGRAH